MIYSFGFLTFFTSMIITLVFIKTKSFHIDFTVDTRQGPQKIHSQEVIRIGGFSIFLSNLIIYFFLPNEFSGIILALLISSFFAFFSGLLEDLTKKISPYYRLSGSIISGFVFINLLDIKIDNIDIDFLQFLFQINLFAIIFTALSVALLIQSMNIIDGLNGLSMGYAILVLISILLVSIKVEDQLLGFLIIFTLGSVLGSFIFNFPKSYIFLGDGGAYYLGAFLAFYIIIMITRNEVVSPFYCLLLVLYPVYETVRSFIRRFYNSKSQSFSPDQWHLHSLVYKYLQNKRIFSNTNSFASFSLLIFQMIFLIIGFCFFENKLLLIILNIIFILIYELIYLKLKLVV